MGKGYIILSGFLENKYLSLIYCFTIFLGALLMFLIQPLIGKIITPVYGGSSQVWCLCLLFFQLTLLGGYSLIHFLNQLPVKRQIFIYISLLVISAFFVHIPVSGEWALSSNVNTPILSLLSGLFRYIALPAVLLSTISVVMQNFYRVISPKSPFYLYSISNIGSLVALLSYPLLIEPNISIETTLTFWIWGYMFLIVIACISSGLLFKFFNQNNEVDLSGNTEHDKKPAVKDYVFWVFASASGTILLISFTNYICHDIASVPLLWIIPLTLYLLSFIVAFSHEKAYIRSLFVFVGLALTVIISLTQPDFPLPDFISLHLHLPGKIMIALLALFFLCTICHGEIYRSKPQPKYLSNFYLSIASGGALGGVLINIIFPFIFNDYFEFFCILLVMGFFSCYLIFRYNLRLLYNKWIDKAFIITMICIISYGFYLGLFLRDKEEKLALRNFYGTAKLYLENDGRLLNLYNGTTLHGSQLVDQKTGKLLYNPISYYGPDSAVGITDLLLRAYNGHKPVKIGVIGLGAGTVAAYGRNGDKITFYEIDPKIKYFAQKYFDYNKTSRAKVNIIMGDGRLAMSRQSSQNYDLIIVDAFSSDSIPVHLLTEEALKLYLSHLKHNGIILFHLSNKYLDLVPVISNNAINLSLKGTILSISEEDPYSSSTYSAITRESWYINGLKKIKTNGKHPGLEIKEIKLHPELKVWTDSYSNILSVFMKD